MKYKAVIFDLFETLVTESREIQEGQTHGKSWKVFE